MFGGGNRFHLHSLAGGGRCRRTYFIRRHLSYQTGFAIPDEAIPNCFNSSSRAICSRVHLHFSCVWISSVHLFFLLLSCTGRGKMIRTQAKTERLRVVFTVEGKYIEATSNYPKRLWKPNMARKTHRRTCRPTIST